MKKITDEEIINIYDLVNERDTKLYSMYRVLDEEDTKYEDKKDILEFLNIMANTLGLKINNDTYLALLNRIIMLREDSLIDILETYELTEKEKLKIKRKAFQFTKSFQIKTQKNLLDEISNQKINEFYKVLIRGIFDIGNSMSELHIKWEDHIILKQNPELEKKYGDNVIKFLKENDLLEIDGRTNEFADRSYSVLIEENNEYKKISYKEAFPNEVNEVTNKIDILLENLRSLPQYNDEELNWKNYLYTLKMALSETDTNYLIEKWAEVDIYWMRIEGPIQMGHPLEYYEDKYRNSVAIEMDLRIDNIKLSENTTFNKVKNMFEKIHNKTFKENEKIIKNNKELLNYYKKDYQKMLEINNKNLELSQLHIGKQMFYFGSNLNGLSSAQVVPNDELVSNQFGKKIFAFAEKSITIGQSKPPLLIGKLVFGEELQKESYDLLYNREEDFLKIYDITTIGHEYGHILWKTNWSEVMMNDTCNYKNIEEFKASSGGLMAFFDTDDEVKLWREVFINTIKRAVGLIGWKKNSDVEAYYCEGLITLQILFNNKVIEFNNNKAIFNITKETYELFKKEYKKEYENLVYTYINLKDANKFLEKFCKRAKSDGFMYPIIDNKYEFSSNCRSFVNYYYDLQLKLSTKIDIEFFEYVKNLRKNKK